MKLARVTLVEQTKTPSGIGIPGQWVLNNVEGSLNQHGLSLPYVDPATKSEMEHLVPWARIIGITRERQPAK